MLKIKLEVLPQNWILPFFSVKNSEPLFTCDGAPSSAPLAKRLGQYRFFILVDINNLSFLLFKIRTWAKKKKKKLN